MDRLPGKSVGEEERAGRADAPVSAVRETVVWGKSSVGVRRRKLLLSGEMIRRSQMGDE